MMHLKWSKEPLVWIRFVDKSVCVWKTSSFLQMGFKLNGSTFLFLSGVRKSLICLSLFPHSNVLFATQLNITSSRLNILEVRRMLNVIKSIPICMVDALTGPKSWDIDNWSWFVVCGEEDDNVSIFHHNQRKILLNSCKSRLHGPICGQYQTTCYIFQHLSLQKMSWNRFETCYKMASTQYSREKYFWHSDHQERR